MYLKSQKDKEEVLIGFYRVCWTMTTAVQGKLGNCSAYLGPGDLSVINRRLPLDLGGTPDVLTSLGPGPGRTDPS